MSIIAKRISKLKPSPTLAVTQKARELKAKGVDVIGLGAGEPDFDTPQNIKEYAKKAIDDGKTKYTAVGGIPQLKDAIVNKLKRDNSLNFDPDSIIVGTGGKQVLFNAILASVNPGEEVIIPSPYWVSYPDMVLFADGVPVIVKCDDKSNFKMTPSQLEAAITSKTKWLILNSPSNPTGSCYTKDELKGLAEVLMRHPHVNIMSDDIYEHIVYDGFEFYNIKTVEPNLGNRVLVVNGVSKAYSMTGWRIGYAAGSKDLIKAMAKLQSQSTSNPCSISQYAAVEALNGPQDYINKNNLTFKRRRDLAIGILNSVDGIECLVPEGAFYLYPNCSSLVGRVTVSGKKLENCTDIASFFLEEAEVAVVPGVAFGLENYVRISYATSDELLQKACERIQKACATLK